MRIPAVIMRGGTSKGLFFHERDLPADPDAADRFILAAYGSPDPYRRQIDGLGGATSTTSKVAVIGDGGPYGVDVTYQFGQVSIDEPLIDRRGNCGNMSSAVGPFAVDEGLVEASDPVTTVRFLNVNTGKVIVAHVATRDGRFDPVGELAIPGIPGTGSPVRLDYLEPGGAVTGALLPTGRQTDVLDVPKGPVEVSLVDASNPLVFVRFEDVGLTGTEQPEEIDSDAELLATLETIRAAAGVRMGVAADLAEAARTPSVPKLALVGESLDYVRIDGVPVGADEAGVRAVMLSMGRTHRSYPLTGAICTAVATQLPDTVAARANRPDPAGVTLIGHPSGVLEMQAQPRLADGVWTVDAVSAYRTARRLMEGWALVPEDAAQDAQP